MCVCVCFWRTSCVEEKHVNKITRNFETTLGLSCLCVVFISNSFRRVRLAPHTLRHKITRRKNYWGIHLCANTCRACIRTRANTGKYFREMIFRMFCQILGGNSLRCEHMPRLHSHLRKYRKIVGKLFIYIYIY